VGRNVLTDPVRAPTTWAFAVYRDGAVSVFRKRRLGAARALRWVTRTAWRSIGVKVRLAIVCVVCVDGGMDGMKLKVELQVRF
jgi:hypothetical protein